MWEIKYSNDIMMYEDKFEVEFIRRTIILLEQYKQCKFISREDKYENTLFLNMCLGLLIIPRQAYHSKLERLKNENATNEFWGIPDDAICLGTKNVYDVVRHMRNGIVHNHCEFLSEDKENISHIMINDFKPNGLHNFSIKLTTQKFSEFVLLISNYFIK